MKLTKSTDFALRVVLKLAESKELCTMPQLSEQLAISYNNLSKIIQQLNKGGIVETKQGKNGGIQLAKSSQDISLKHIIHIIDGPTVLASCMKVDDYCQFNCDCRLKACFFELQGKIDALFDDVKISQLVKGS